MRLSELKEQIKKSEASVIFFTAPWCKPCKSLYPIFDDLKKHNTRHNEDKIAFFKISVEDENSDSIQIANYYKIKTFPTFFFFYKGKMVTFFEGADKEKLAKEYNSLLDKVL